MVAAGIQASPVQASPVQASPVVDALAPAPLAAAGADGPLAAVGVRPPRDGSPVSAAESLAAAVERYDAGDYATAERLARAAAADRPGDAAPLRLLGTIVRKLGRLGESLAALREATQLAPQDPLGHFELGATLLAGEDRLAALECFQTAATLRPTFSEAVLNVGAILEQHERYDEALPWQRRAVELRPTCHLSHFNLANSLRATGDLPAAIRHYSRAIELQPDYARGHWNLAVTLLTNGEFAAGWDEHEWRDAAGEVALDSYPYPRWRGESLAGKRLLVCAEQGIGDEVLFASCYSELIAQAQHCVLVCDPRLAPLFERSFPTATVHGYLRRADRQPLALVEPIDVQTPAGSVPRWMRRSVADFPRNQRFLTADSAQTETWRRRFAELGAGLKVGLSWRAGGKPAERRKRTTGLEQWGELLATPGVEWINLQYGDATEDLHEARQQLGATIHDFATGDPLVDMDAFAAKVSALDLVISVGNATVHLAGALGVPAWAMLPLTPAWRWLHTGAASPWYASVRLFRQRRRGDWQDVFAEIAAALRERAGLSASKPPTIPNRTAALDVGRPISASPAAERRTNSAIQFIDLNDEQIAELLERGLGHHQRGELPAAEAIYRDVLDHFPRHADALHLLGQLYCRTGRGEQGLQSMRRAIAVADGIAVFHISLGDALATLDRPAEAADSYQRAASLAPNDGAIRLRWARALRAACRVDSAIEQLEAAADLLPLSAAPLVEWADALLDDDRPGEALGHALAVASLAPNDAAAHRLVGQVQRRLGDAPAAIAAWERAIAIDPAQTASLAALGEACLQQNDSGRAVEYLRRAAALQPNSPAALHALGLAEQETGDFAAALAAYDAALSIDPQCAAAHASRALLNLLLGNLAAGWDEYEWRWQTSDGGRARRHFGCREWNGEPLCGRALLIHGEQGIGDEIMFATCYREAIARAGRAVIACDQRLRTLFARSFPEAEVHGVWRGHEHAWLPPASAAIGAHAPAGSLPRLFRRDRSSFPDAGRWLRPDERLVDLWRERLAGLGAGLKVGISWRGGKSEKDRRLRWTSLDQWSPILRAVDARFVSLHHGATPDEIAAARDRLGVDLASWSDFDPLQHTESLAALIASLDLVISAGNANVHFAGALDVPAWALLPRYDGWRWMLGEGRSQWYRSVRLFRQQQCGDWPAVMARVAAEFVKFADGARR